MKRSAAILLAAALVVGCTSKGLRNGDLVFCHSGDSEFDSAIGGATFRNEGDDFTHVGIVEIAADGIYIIEAVPQRGVCRTPYDAFVTENGCPTVMRLDDKAFDGGRAVDNAKRHLGEAYDFCFLPDNGKMYCSELVCESFVDADGAHLFTARPMNFRLPDGSMPDYWVELFDSLGMAVPENVLGTNPNDLAREPILRRVELKR